MVGELQTVLARTLDLLHRNALPTTTEQARFFLRRVRALYEKARSAPPSVLDRLEARQERERQILTVASAVRVPDSPGDSTRR